MGSRGPTLRDVAQRAGVSVGTASGVFANKPSVSREAREAVLQAATEVGYQPRTRPANLFADGLRMIGFITPSTQQSFPANPFYSHVLHGAQQACARLGLSLTYEVVSGEAAESWRPPLIVRDNQVQGLLLVGSLQDEFLRGALRHGLPSVVIDHRPEGVEADVVCNDDIAGGTAATELLLDAGHTDPPPAMIAGPLDSSSIRNRLEGYRRALMAREMPVDPDYVRLGDLNPGSGRTEMHALLDLPEPPTAVFCCNDATALGALEALRERGIPVPEGCSVVGYDDTEMATHCVPPLTTVQVDKELLGAQGVWHLIGRAQTPQLTPRDTRLSVALVHRGSVAPPPAVRTARVVRQAPLSSRTTQSKEIPST